MNLHQSEYNEIKSELVFSVAFLRNIYFEKTKGGEIKGMNLQWQIISLGSGKEK